MLMVTLPWLSFSERLLRFSVSRQVKGWDLRHFGSVKIISTGHRSGMRRTAAQRFGQTKKKKSPTPRKK